MRECLFLVAILCYTGMPYASAYMGTASWNAYGDVSFLWTFQSIDSINFQAFHQYV